MKKIALCVTTYNKKENIEIFLKCEIDIVKKYKIDLYIFDSSDNNYIENTMKPFLMEERVYYEKMDSNLTSAEKVFLIYQKFEYSDYDYIWMTHDHTEIKDEAFEIVLGALNNNEDFVVINMNAVEYCNIKICSLDDFMFKSALILRRFGTAIVSIKGFINGSQWSEILKKFLKKDTMDFSHVGYYLDRASEIQDFKSSILEIPHEYFRDYTRDKKSSWYYNTLRISTECWGKVILCQSFKYSKNAKRRTLKSGGCTTLTPYKLILIKKENRYNLFEYLKYFKWIRVSYTLKDLMRFGIIAVLPIKVVTYVYNWKLRMRINKEKHNGNKVVIYGAGRFATECAIRFEDAAVEYDGFIVETMNDNPDNFNSHNVYIAKDYIKKNDCFVVIAIAKNGVNAVKNYLDSINGKGKLKYIEFGDL